MEKKKPIYGRDKEILRFEKLVASKRSEFLAVFGRRRVGKTYLIMQHFHNRFDFRFAGLANATTAQQLFGFFNALNEQSNLHLKEIPTDWMTAFELLKKHLKNIKHKGKKVIFLDEMPWMDTPRSDFILALENFWNGWAYFRKDILLIACGSATSWIINKLINNKGGLHNRITERIKLNPFTLKETEAFLESKNTGLDRYQIVQLYMVTGGVPYYLENIEKGKSAAQNTEQLCFIKGGLLQFEFNNLFASLFRNYEKHTIIVKAIATKTKGLTRKEILDITKLPTGGTTTKIFNEIEESGFISKYVPFGKKKRDTLYRLSDFYTSFYFKFIENNTNFEKGNWTNNIDNPAYRSWSGYAFEQVCLAHIPQIKKALGISGMATQSFSWKSKLSKKGAQIDLLIDRKDNIINLCEIKFSQYPFTIDKKYAENLRNKLGTFKEETKTKKAVFLSVISTFGLKQNMHSNSLIHNEVLMDALFEF